MKKMKKVVLFLTLGLIVNLGCAQQADFKADVMKYLKLSGASSAVKMLTKDIINNIDDDKKEAFQKDLDNSINELMSLTANVYMTEFTHQEIKAILKFYESPEGKKLASKTELITEKGQEIAQEWGMSFQTMLMKYLQ